MKQTNSYTKELGDLYGKIPKSVFAAIALSFAFIDVQEKGFDDAVVRLLAEWLALHDNGIVTQRPPKWRKKNITP